MRPIDIFISYKREDRAAAEPLAQYFAARGYKVWWDAELLSGDNFILEIFEVLKSAKTAIVLWSDEALSSRFVIGEALFALNRHIYIGASLKKAIELPPPFNAVHFEDVSRWREDASTFGRLVEAIARKAGKPSPTRADEDLMKAAVDEAVFWRGIADSDRADGYRLYLDRYGEAGIFSELAKRRLDNQTPPRAVHVPAPPRTVEIAAGSFLMGSPAGCSEGDDDERPLRRVTFAKAFRFGAAPVSFDEFEAFTTATRRAPPLDFGMARGAHPAVNVSWHDAVDYCRWLSSATGRVYRLPAEAEWEFAARAGSTRARPWGDDWDATRANGAATVGRTTLPGTYPENAFGIYDVIGNVWEWCADPLHNGYAGAPGDGSVWQSGGDATLRVIRGGSFDDLPQALRSAMRGWYRPEDQSIRIGFRVVEEISA